VFQKAHSGERGGRQVCPLSAGHIGGKWESRASKENIQSEPHVQEVLERWGGGEKRRDGIPERRFRVWGKERQLTGRVLQRVAGEEETLDSRETHKCEKRLRKKTQRRMKTDGEKREKENT